MLHHALGLPARKQNMSILLSAFSSAQMGGSNFFSQICSWNSTIDWKNYLKFSFIGNSAPVLICGACMTKDPNIVA